MKFSARLDKTIKQSEGKQKISKIQLNQDIEHLMYLSFKQAEESQEKFIYPRNILMGLTLLKHSSLERLFYLFNIEKLDLVQALILGRFKRRLARLSRLPGRLEEAVRFRKGIRHRVMNRAWTARPTPTLDRYGLDLTSLARAEKIGFLIGHQKEYQQLVEAISTSPTRAVILIGEPGTGKSALINHLAYQIVKDRVPPLLFDKRLVRLDISRLVSNAEPGEISHRLNSIINEIILAGNVILYIPDIDNLVKTSGKLYLSAIDILLPAIKAGSFPVIGSTYPREYRQFIEPQSDFASAFRKIRVEEISPETALKILMFDSVILENKYKVGINYQALKAAVNLSYRYLRPEPLPGIAEQILREALEQAIKSGKKVVEREDVITVIEKRTNIPIHEVSEVEAEQLLNLEKLIHQTYVNQNEAVSAVSRVLKEYRSGLRKRTGPIAVFLFLGPTGVGKTYLCKILAKIQFGREELIRFDMSEYQTQKDIYRLIGSPDGKVRGRLTELVSKTPYSLILLDEFEKTHPDLLNLFLQVFDEGRLTDALGRTVDFKNTIIIATSNAGSNFIQEQLQQGKKVEQFKDELKKRLTRYFKPELINRFSDIIVFRTLTMEDIKTITKLQLNQFAKELEKNQGITFLYSSQVVDRISKLGFDPAYGARPISRVISEKIRGVLAEKILKKEIGRGNTVKVELIGNRFEFIVK